MRPIPRVPFLLLLLCAIAPAVAAPPVGPERWEPEIVKFEEADQAAPPKPGAIVFTGSSSIRLWKTLAEDFPQHRVVNRGFGGSQISDSIHLAERTIFPHEPRLVVFYAGGNDINAGKTPDQVLSDFIAFSDKVLKRLPKTEIAYISIAGNPKRWAQVEDVKAANAKIAEHCRATPRLKFINVFPHMLGPDGNPRPEIFSVDQLHMNAAGYKLWREIVRPYLGPADWNQ